MTCSTHSAPRRLLVGRPANAIQRTASADLHQLDEGAWPLRLFGLERLAEGVEVDSMIRDASVDPAQSLGQDDGGMLGG